MPTARVQPAREACLEGPPAAGLGSRGGRDAGSPSAASLRKRSGRVARGRPQMWGREGIPCVLLLPHERLAPPKPPEAGMFLLAISDKLSSTGLWHLYNVRHGSCNGLVSSRRVCNPKAQRTPKEAYRKTPAKCVPTHRGFADLSLCRTGYSGYSWSAALWRRRARRNAFPMFDRFQ